MRWLWFMLLLIPAASGQSLTISYSGPLTISAGAITPFTGISIDDTNAGATSDIVTISLSGSAGGTLQGAGLTGTGPYTLTTTPASMSADLAALRYTPAFLNGSTVTFAMSVTSYQTTTLGTASGAVEITNLNLTDEVPFPAPAGTFTPRNFKGVNIAGAEQGYPASSGGCSPNCSYNYIYPLNWELDYFNSKGMGLVRLPLDIRRIQPVSYGSLDPIGRTDEPPWSGATTGTQTNLLSIKAVLDHAMVNNMWVVLDPHNYGSIKDTATNTYRPIGTDPEGTAQFVDWWVRVSTKFKNYPNVIFGLMNEPAAQGAAAWKIGAVAAINGIAQVTNARWIFIPGASWTGAHSWVGPGDSNANAWAGYIPPLGMKTAFEVHEYLDSNYSGTHAVCAGFGSAPMTAITGWAQANNVNLWIGEIGWSTDASCTPDATALMAYVSANQPIYMGWAYWLGGSYAFYGSYSYTVQPTGYPTGPFTDAPQTSILTGNLN